MAGHAQAEHGTARHPNHLQKMIYPHPTNNMGPNDRYKSSYSPCHDRHHHHHPPVEVRPATILLYQPIPNFFE